MKRCINIDWLEIYVYEPIGAPRDADYFRSYLWSVNERHYGTRQYQEMFTLVDADGHPFIEIRRKPYTTEDKCKFIPANGAHIRFHNRSCYFTGAVNIMRNFLAEHNYTFKRIYRIDICLDFITFDTGVDPQQFIKEYLTGIYTKINQCSISAHGTDNWHGRDWHSLKWGQLTSDVNTKLYCKTLELKQVGDKPYIRQAWFAAGLIDDPIHLFAHKADQTPYEPAIWRLEFSIKSDGRKVFVMRQGGDEHGHKIFMANTLEAYDSDDKLLATFAALVSHYFCFKVYKPNVRKSRCKDKKLFKFSPKDSFYTVENLATEKPRSSSLERFLLKVKEFQITASRPELFKAAGVIINYLEELQCREQLSDPYDNAQLKAMQLALHIAMRTKASSLTAKQIEELSELFRAGQIY